MEQVNAVIFYSIEKAIKCYRKLAQKELKKHGLDITVDQWLTLSALNDNSLISQKELGDIVFKDNASVTRIISLLIKNGYLKRGDHGTDKRRSALTITAKGRQLLRRAEVAVKHYRARALKNISSVDRRTTRKVMNTIILNTKT